MKKIVFPKEFLWGATTASYQIEGAAFEDGKGESIWDRFAHTPGRISDGTNGDVGCDHYHLYKDDIAIMKELGLQAYRLSISWPRIFPDGTGQPNAKGIEFYKNLLEELRANGIKTMVTLYHWDLPQTLQDKGGWVNRQIADDFELYARHVFEQLDGLVDWWITFNEPFCSAFLGYWKGVHAPGIQDYSSALAASHHLLLAHGKAVRAFRETGTKGEIGITLNMDYYYPLNDCDEDRRAAELSHAAFNAWFADPIFKGKYPEAMLDFYRDKVVLPEIHESDLALISEKLDFLGLNHYFSDTNTPCPDKWPLGVKTDFIGGDRTDMGWGINPDGFYDLLMRLNKDYGDIPIYITENGCATRDIVNVRGEVEDHNRIDFLTRYISAAHRALKDGVNLKGYYQWSLLDNFEWSFGFSKRFGIVHVDYKTLKRTIKKSGRWYSEVIAENGF